MKQLCEFAGGLNRQKLKSAARMSSDDFKLARRRLAKVVPVPDDFELARLRARLDELEESAWLHRGDVMARIRLEGLRSDCLKYIAQLTLVKMRSVAEPEVGGV